MQSGIFFAARLDGPNQIETVRQIPLSAQRDFAAVRVRGEADLADFPVVGQISWPFFSIDLHQPGFDAPRMFFSIDLDERNGGRGARP
jgi:hypothetical protein